MRRVFSPFWSLFFCWASSPRWSGGGWLSIKTFGFGFFTSSEWNPVTGEFGAAGADLRHAGHVVHRLVDRHPGEFRHRAVPDRALAGLAAPAAGHRDRTAGRRYPASSTACGACSCSRRSSPTTSSRWLTRQSRALAGHRVLFKGAPHGHRHADRGHHPVDHGHSLHRVGHARRVRAGAAAAEGIGLRSRRDDLGSHAARRAAVYQGRRDRRRSCSGSGARWAKPWR